MAPTSQPFALACLTSIAMLTGCGGSNGGSPLPFQPSQAQKQRSPNHAFKVLYTLKGERDGANPSGAVVFLNGALYGVTSNGGSGCGGQGCGTVYRINTSGQETVVYAFKGGFDGANPTGKLLLVKGELYGSTTSGGGSGPSCSSCGTIFKVGATGHERIIYRFKGSKDGYYPNGGLTLLGGILYGTTVKAGGSTGWGTVFGVTLSGKLRTIYRFTGGADGGAPNGGLIVDGGMLYGTTFYGGHCKSKTGCGTVFVVSTSGNERVLHSFPGRGSSCYGEYRDGAYPLAGLFAMDGTLYGTTYSGGLCIYNFSLGTVFAVTTNGRERTLRRFNGPDGANPRAGLIGADGTLYGTTASGGQSNGGVVFSMTTTGREHVLHRFSYLDGESPYAGLTASMGTLYGNTYGGGSAGYGTVFEIAP